MLILKQFIPANIKTKLRQFIIDRFDGYSIKSYSQEGEDMILRRIFENKGTGFYVDVGAHHPQRFSNTYFFYKNGWRGINIDARPGSMDQFNKLRPRDINIEAAIAREQRELTYYMFNDPALNTFDENLSASRNREPYKLIGTKHIVTQRLDQVLHRHLPRGQAIDFMTVDVEGLDLQVLESNDWNVFMPRYLLVENSNADMTELTTDAINGFMVEHNYLIIAKSLKTVIYKNRNEK